MPETDPTDAAAWQACLVADRLWAEARLRELGAPALAVDKAQRLRGALASRFSSSTAEVTRRTQLPITLSYPENLPVSGSRERILETMRTHRCFVLTGETGSGKTTQLPKLMLEAGYGRRGMVAVTQPRRVAAFAIAERLRAETASGPGVVAHSVRFDDQAGPDTVLRVMTDGLLLAELENDPALSRYDAIMIDEAHERSLTIDMLLGLVSRVRERRPDLLLAVSSASIEAERFARYLGGAAGPVPVIAVSGRTFPVTVEYRPPYDSEDEVGYLQAAIQAIRDVHAQPTRGDVLCFLPTERDIIEAVRRLRDLPGAEVMALFSRLTPGEQKRVFQGTRGRKVVLATNIAETSLTIPGITVVIDSGLARIKRYHAASRTERLPIEAVSQASCLQRAGRAGRIEAGHCIRLYGEEDFSAREAFATPEIQRSNLAGVLLSCLAMAIDVPEEFPWLDPPAPQAWRQARLLLEELGALSDATVGSGTLTGIGQAMAQMPADPQVARMLISGLREGVAHEACTIAAFLSIQDPRVRPLGKEAKADAAHRVFAHEAGDLATVLNLWEQFQAQTSNGLKARFCDTHYLGYRRMREFADVRHQLWSSLRSSPGAKGRLPVAGFTSETWPLDRIHRCVLSGMIGNVLMYDREKRAYRAAGDRLLHVHPGSAIRSGKADDGKRAPPPAPWLVACEIVETSRLFARLCAPIDPEWVVVLAGDRVKRRHRQPHYHRKRQQVFCTETITWKGLPVRDGRMVPYERVEPRAATEIYIREALCSDDPSPEAIPGLELIVENRRTVALAERLMHRLRNPGLALDRVALERFYREHFHLEQVALAAGQGGEAIAAPPALVIASSDALRRHLRSAPEGSLRLRLEAFIPAELLARADADFPEHVDVGTGRKALLYAFHPGADDDGATLDLSATELPRVDPARLEWAVPGWIEPRVEALLTLLPKDSRRLLIPFAQRVRELSALVRAQAPPPGPGMAQESMAELLRTALVERFAIPAPDFSAEQLPLQWRLRLRIREANGQISSCGRDLAPLEAHAISAPERLTRLRLAWDSQPAAGWGGDCPGMVSRDGVRGFVAMARSRDARGAVAARRAVYATETAGRAWHDDGLDALLEAALAPELETMARAVPGAGVGRCETILGISLATARRQLAVGLLVSGGERYSRSTAMDEAGWEDLLRRSRASLLAASPGFDRLLGGIIEQASLVKGQLKRGLSQLAALPVMDLVEEGLGRLLASGWHLRLPWATIERLPVYLGHYLTVMQAAAVNIDQPRRLCARASDLVAAWDEALQDDGRRWAMALGRGRQLRELAGGLEECVDALIVPGGVPSVASGLVATAWRQGLAALTKDIGLMRTRVRQARSELIELRPVVSRHPTGRRERLQGSVDAAIGSLPDLGLGADLAHQLEQAAALAARMRAPV